MYVNHKAIKCHDLFYISSTWNWAFGVGQLQDLNSPKSHHQVYPCMETACQTIAHATSQTSVFRWDSPALYTQVSVKIISIKSQWIVQNKWTKWKQIRCVSVCNNKTTRKARNSRIKQKKTKKRSKTSAWGSNSLLCLLNNLRVQSLASSSTSLGHFLVLTW